MSNTFFRKLWQHRNDILPLLFVKMGFKDKRWYWENHREFALDRIGLNNNIIRHDDQFLNMWIQAESSEEKIVQNMREIHNIYYFVDQVKDVPGDLAEVGVYKGGSAKVICESKGSKVLHLFDTFEGMPESNAAIDYHKKGDFGNVSLEEVKEYLNGYESVLFHKGIFPHSADTVKDKKFCFVHLDVDLYESTKSSLEFFYKRLNRGGVMLSHDYRSISCPGVKKAIDDFFDPKPETVIPLWDTECLIIKL